jgi:hypothetical protein
MKRLLKVAFAALLFFLCTSSKPVKHGAASTKDNTHYYWYLDNGTVYDGWYTTADEITRLEARYDVYIDTDQIDGTLIASGYGIKGYPHYVYASVFLYSH